MHAWTEHSWPGLFGIGLGLMLVCHNLDRYGTRTRVSFPCGGTSLHLAVCFRTCVET
jgi:hypothetical protein